jgi:hypothetical protein
MLKKRIKNDEDFNAFINSYYDTNANTVKLYELSTGDDKKKYILNLQAFK